MAGNKRPSELNLSARRTLQSLEDAVLKPAFIGIKKGVLAVWTPFADHIDRAKAPDKYRLLLKQYYPEFPDWHLNPRRKSKEPFNPENPHEGRVVDVFFLEKYEQKDPVLFKRLMQIRIEYFEKLKK